MRKPLYVAVKIVLTLLIVLCAAEAAEIKNLSQAVDVAGKQRMFTQRMLKDYAMIGLENPFGNPKKDLQKTMTDFEDHLDALIAFNKDPKTDASLMKVKKMWTPVKAALKETPRKEKAAKMQEDLEALLKQSNEAVGLFAKQTGKESGEIINISGRQRMLSQRMASLYMLKVWGINDPKFKEKMDQAMKLFKTSLERLKASKMNTPEITALLNKAQRSFMFFEIMNRSQSKFIPALIYKKSNDILKNMNTATGLYAAQEK
ncbi:type IV pili methyl-accepting chemotaxis transducer N-terminal domain-containing protein [Sulfurovum sp.]|uniref:type IV pili methyl-accepting chemotaxis transducer N-terminal domain-containing protein n=1 Tax=Sulfurovum sp. TaxID=1969726 RepID=UPI0025E473E7|nr:type IV pili methyl-accepting chemotaxis transducer N-terminal domain-containing protein [Sulfurovum sp.]